MDLEKSWYWSRAEKKTTTRIRAVQTTLAWWKACRAFKISLYIDGAEYGVGFFLCIPFLFSLSVLFHCEPDWYKRKFPKTYAADAYMNWEIAWTSSYLAIYWADMDTMDSSTRTGFHWIKSWSDILKGNCYHQDRGKPYALLEELRFVKIKYPKSSGEKRPITFTVYRQNIKHFYRRWLPSTTVRYHVATDSKLLVPGDGENEWDLDDEEIGGPFHEESQSADLVVYANSPKAAIDQVIADYYRRAGYHE